MYCLLKILAGADLKAEHLGGVLPLEPPQICAFISRASAHSIQSITNSKAENEPPTELQLSLKCA